MQTSIHASGGLIGDFDGILQNASGDNMLLRAWCRFPSDEHTVVWMAVHSCCLQKIIQRGKPASHQVYILNKKHFEKILKN